MLGRVLRLTKPNFTKFTQDWLYWLRKGRIKNSFGSNKKEGSFKGILLWKIYHFKPFLTYLEGGILTQVWMGFGSIWKSPKFGKQGKGSFFGKKLNNQKELRLFGLKGELLRGFKGDY